MEVLSRINEKKVGSIQELLEIIEKENPLGNKWFRGQHDSSYYLTPSVYRNIYTIYDQFDRPVYPTLFQNNYNTRGDKQFIPDGLYLQSFYDLLDKENIAYDNTSNYAKRCCLAQHYGVKTRVLDWTLDATVALYFATDNNKGNDVALFILDPIALNKMSINCDNVLSVDNMIHPDQFMFPIAFSGNREDKRMCRQSGNFTMQGSMIWPLDIINGCSEYLVKIVIPSDLCNQIKCILKSFGITYDNIYLGNDIKDAIAEKAAKYTDSIYDKFIEKLKEDYSNTKLSQRGIIHSYCDLSE